MFGLAQRLEDHRQEDSRHFADIRADSDRKHAENQSAIATLSRSIQDQEASARQSSNRMLLWIIGVLLTVIGSILVQTLHFKVSLG